MQNDWFHMLWLSCAFLILFGTAEVLYHFLHVRAEISRKFVHVLTGALTLFFPLFLESHWSVLLLCLSFALILLLSLRWGWLPSINAIGRKSRGSLLYPLSVYLCFLFFSCHHHRLLYFYLPVLTLAICDPAAALIGKRFPYGKFKIGGGNKSLMGCLVFFVVSMVLTLSLYACLENIFPWNEKIFTMALTTAVIGTITEALSGNGWDNLSIPLSVMLLVQVLGV